MELTKMPTKQETISLMKTPKNLFNYDSIKVQPK